MDEFLRNSTSDRSTVFESGYGLGYLHVEVRQLRFEVVTLTGGGEYDAAIFIERGKRKEKVLPLNRLVILEGWDHPKLEASTPERLPSGVVVHHPKFPVFDKGWDDLLNAYLAANASTTRLIVDGRDRPEFAVRAGRGRPMPVPTTTSPRDAGKVDNGASIALPFFSEGAVESLLLDRFERDPGARKACLEHFGFGCQVCGTLMSETYGARGDGYIHVHHKVPLSQIRDEYVVDPVHDLVPVCPNCHAMLHRTDVVMSVDELAEIVRVRRGAAPQGVAAAAAPRRR